jgi:3-oxoadipate enol-lactonase
MGSLSFQTIGSGETVITALHSLALSGGWYESIAAAMPGDYTWLLPDLPGHGSSAYGPAPVTLDSLGEDVVALWDRLGIARSALVGVSLGGMVAQSVTDRARDRVWAQVLVCTTHAYPDAALLPARERIRTVRSAADMSVLVEPTVGRWFTSAQLETDEPLVARARSEVRSGEVRVHADYLEAMLGLDYVGATSAWNPPPPTLVIGGREDRSTPPAVVEAMAAAIDGSESAFLDGGHLAVFEHPEEAGRLISSFLRTHAPSPAA